ncbi:hypothetical protein [Candidatus Palauibacter sp.]|uniref:hypothetical protein n=1 Tax=Candidatus Palauibacter sp. TaxID=3101350 RepID=UPI003B019A52
MVERDDRPQRPEEGIEASVGSDAGRQRDAERIARDERNMHAVLSAMAKELSERLSDPMVDPATPLHDPMAPSAPERRHLSWKWTAGPLAAAAVVAALLLLPNGAIEEVSGPAASPPRSMVSEMDVEADRPFVVFPTNDPDIAVVWLLSPEESD